MMITIGIALLLCLLVVWTVFVSAIGLYLLVEYGALALDRDQPEPTEPDTATLAAQIEAATLRLQEGKR